MTDTNDLRDSLRMSPRGRWTAARLCGAIVNAPTRKRTITSIKPSTKPPTSPWQATPPDTTVQTCKICGILVNGSYEHAHNQVHQADYEQFATASPGTAETCKICGILINRSTKTRTAAVTGSCRRSARRR
jgi:hypothetical protein